MRILYPFMLLFLIAIAGAETKISLQGMKSISEEDVRKLIGKRFEHITGQNASPARASDSAFMVEQLFRKAGFNDATVSWKILSPNLIQLTIDEGKRDALGTVTIEGVENEAQAETLRRLFRLNPEKRLIQSGGAPPLREEDVEDGLDLMRNQLKSIGFWEPTLTVRDQRLNPETGLTDFVIRIDAGKVFRIATPTFTGAPHGGVENVVAAYVGRPANTTNINALRLRATEYYRAKGFVNAKIRMSAEARNGKVHPAFEVNEGKRFRFGDVTFTGLEKTNPERIRTRLAPLRTSTYIDANKVDQRIRQLIATGAFSTLRTETRDRGDGVLDATLHFEEAQARGMTYTAGFDSFEGSILGASYYDRNFFGQLRNFSAGGEVTGRSLLGEISLTDPWLWGTDAQGQVRLFSFSRDNEGYDIWQTGLEGSIRYPMNDHYTIAVRLGITTNSTSEDGLPPTDLGETQYQNPYLTINNQFDFRDSKILPTEGWLLEVPFTLGAAVGTQSTGYLRTGFAASYYRPLSKSSQLSLGARAFVLIPSGNNLPIDLRLFNGGPRSVRSFPERELGPRSVTNYPIGGEASWVTNVEYIRTLAGALKGVVFVDAGGLSPEWEDFGMNEIDVALGLGLRLDLPIGPVRLEYGHNLTKDANEPSGSWHFAIGTAF
ncbi:MAG: BamA/TamA family outer membrane protein [Verrucomicrobiota bacterium]